MISESFPSQVTWVTLLRDMLFQYGFGYVWVEQSVTREFLSLFEQRVKDNYLQEWDAQVRSTSDFRLFKKIKDSLNLNSIKIWTTLYLELLLPK